MFGMGHSFRRYSADFSILGDDSIPVPDLDSFMNETETAVPLKENRFFSQPVFHSDDQNYIFPIIDFKSPIPHISPQTLCSALNGEMNSLYENLFIIDCRFGYEYEGGHIRGAINNSSMKFIKEHFFQNPMKNSIIVFHCEFSHNRGPSVAQMFREIDRFENKGRHPYLYYPDVYILHGGYKAFYEQYPQLCEGGYRTMTDEAYMCNGACCREMAIFKSNVNYGLKQVRRPLSTQPNSQRTLRSPSMPLNKYPKSPQTTKYFTRMLIRFD